MRDEHDLRREFDEGQVGNPVIAVLRVLRRRWPWLLAASLLGLLLGAALAFTTPKSYTATATGWVTVDTADQIALAVSADNLAKSRAVQYRELAGTTLVAQGAVRRSGLQLDPRDAIETVSSTVPRDTSIVRITATGPDPQEAATLANAWLDSLKDEANRLTESDGAATSSAIRFETMVPAEAPSSASAPRVPVYLGGGFLGGVVIGLILIALLEILDTRVRTADDVEGLVGVPPIGIVPKSRSIDNQRRLVAPADGEDQDGRFQIREAFNGLRTNLQFMNPDNPPRAITVTSLSPGDGKSTTAANLAITLTEAGQPVILIDADMRRPTVATSFGLDSRVGLSDVIAGRVSLADALQVPPAHSDLVVLTAGQLPPNPSELLASDRFQQLITELTRTHLVIIDSPPLLSVTDASITAARFDGALLVLDAEKTRRPDIRQALQVLERVHATLLGVVLNRVTPQRGSSAYAYAYAYQPLEESTQAR